MFKADAEIKNEIKQTDLFAELSAPVNNIPQNNGETEYHANIEALIFSNDDNTFAIYETFNSKIGHIRVKSEIGNIFKEGQEVTFIGEWNDDKRYGKQFVAKSGIVKMTMTNRAISKWVMSIDIHGVGIKTAEKIGKAFNNCSENDLLDYKILMERVPGLTELKAKAISNAYEENILYNKAIIELGKYNLSTDIIQKMIKNYGVKASAIIKDNPWIIARDIRGVGFKTSDNLARELGFKPDDPKRYKAALIHGVSINIHELKNTGVSRDTLVSLVSDRINQPKIKIDEFLEKMVGKDKSVSSEGICLDNVSNLVSFASVRDSEKELAEFLHNMVRTPDSRPVMSKERAYNAIQEQFKKLGYTKDDSQFNACMASLTEPVSIITGGPGTGKSTIQKIVTSIHQELDRNPDNLLQAAPTGRAAKRLNKTSGLPASTIHRLLQYIPEDGAFFFNRNKKLTATRIIVDEFSMVDNNLGLSLIESVPETSAFNMVGDIDQLASVMYGQLLKDFINSGLIPVSRLNHFHRQANGSDGIKIAAHRINAGEFPIHDDDTKEDMSGFEWIKSNDDDVRMHVLKVINHARSLGYDPLKDIQILGSMRKGDNLGSVSLNRYLKSLLNPFDEKIAEEETEKARHIIMAKRNFSLGDRLMHLRNDYDKVVTNGEVGFIERIINLPKYKLQEIYVKFEDSDKETMYNPKDIIDVEHAFSATVHKSQGCEFPFVICLCPNEHMYMLNKNLIYTAVTRAQKQCYLIGSTRAVGKAIKTNGTDRITGLIPQLKAQFGYQMDEIQDLSDPFAI